MKFKILNISFLLFACAIPLVIFILPMINGNAIKKLDFYSPFYIYTLQFGLGLLLFIKLSKDFCLWLKEIWLCETETNSKPILILSILLILIILVLTIFFIEGRPRVLSDENMYTIPAQNLYHNQVGTVCIGGSFIDNDFKCVEAATIKPKGLSYLYMLGMPIFGTDLNWIYNFQTFILLFTSIVFFLALVAWLKNKFQALLATVILTTQPVLLLFSRSSSIEGLYVFMFTLSLLFLKWAYDRNTTRHWLLLALTLAFFAQTRPETVFCLLAFIGVFLYKNKFSILDSQLSTFLATLSFFCIPIFSTISINRNFDLQSGTYGAHWHLIENIITDFKIMAFPNYNSEGIFYFPYFPYFTWFALFGLITLVVLTIKEFRSRNFPKPQTLYPIPYKCISAFLLLLSPQYLILFDSIGGDLNIDIQQRYVLIILPVMSFLGALFIYKMATLLNNLINPKILLTLIVSFIFINVIVHYDSFKQNIMVKYNASLVEYYHLKKFSDELTEPSIFFTLAPSFFLCRGISAYNHNLLVDVEENAMNELFEIYKENIFIVENSSCKYSQSIPKVINPGPTRSCDRTISYFDVDTVLNVNLIENRRDALLVYRVLGLSQRDKKGLLRIFEKTEPTDSTVQLYFKILKERIEPWKIQHFINDSLILESPYKKGFIGNTYNFSFFNKDTNIWKLNIIDTITGEQVHSDFWQLVKTGKQ
jgi:hypothetical protein